MNQCCDHASTYILYATVCSAFTN